MSFKVQTAQVDDLDFLEDEEKSSNTFIRSKQDNSILKDAQMSNYLECVDENTVNVIDADTIAFKVASSVEEDYIEVKHIKSGSVKEFRNVTEFRGAGRKPDSISPDSWLGNQNLKLEAKGKAPLSRDDFEVTPKKRLKHENGATVDNIKFSNSEEVMKYYLDQWVEAIKIQTGVYKILPVIGSGENHRHALPLPIRYKEGRVDLERPILLPVARKYLVDKYQAKEIVGGFEADEVVDSYGAKGYRAFKETGKFSFIKSSPDKDACNKEGLLFNYTKDFHFKYPQPWLIHPPQGNEGLGVIEVVKDKIAGTGLKHLCMQLLLGDSADGYGPRAYLPKDVRPKAQYGVKEFYKDFYPLNTQAACLEKVLVKYLEWFPEGVSYPDWSGEEKHFDTLTYLELMFSCVYMKVSKEDTTTFTSYLNAFGVDPTKAVNNNVRVATINSDGELVGKVILDVKTAISELQTLSGVKSGTKPVLVDTLKEINEKLAEIQTKLNEAYQ